MIKGTFALMWEMLDVDGRQTETKSLVIIAIEDKGKNGKNPNGSDT